MDEKPVSKKLVLIFPSSDFIQTFLLSLLSFLICISAYATTFGPLPLTKQMQEAPYIYQGKIQGRWVDAEKNSGKPYTYWNLFDVTVLKSPPNDNGTSVILRQPGGEIGDIGYRIAGTAEFQEGEEVIVFARNTDENNVKEVLGLASGKYAIEENASGKKILKNGIGFIAVNTRNEALSISDFKEILSRTLQGENTEDDKKILFNVRSNHEHENKHVFPDSSNQVNQSFSSSEYTQGGETQTKKMQIDIQKEENAPDKSLTGLKVESSTIFVILAAGLAAFFIGIFWIILKKRK